MKVLLMVEAVTYRDEAKRKKFYEDLVDFMPFWEKKHEGVKYKYLGGWAEQPGHVIHLYEYESMEEFSKVWSDMDVQKQLVKARNLVEDFRIRIMRPDFDVPPI